jgi:TP901 family phage tail tape measure protein
MANYSLGSLFVSMGIDDKGLKTGASSATATLSSLGQTAAATALGFIGANSITSALQSVGRYITDAVKEFATLQTTISQIGDSANLNGQQLQELLPRVRDLADAYYVDDQSVANSLKAAIKAGVEFSDSFDVVGQAIRLSKVSGEDMVTVTQTLVREMKAFNVPTADAAKVANSLFVSIKNGNITLGDMETFMGRIAPIANELGVSFDQLNAMLSALTQKGMSASDAAFALRTVLSSIRSPTKEATDFAKKLGIEFSIASVQAKGFNKWMEDVATATGNSADALELLFPGMRGVGASMVFTADTAKTYNKILKETNTSTEALTDAEIRRAMNLSEQWKDLKNNLEDIGETLADVIGPILALHIKAVNVYIGAFKNVTTAIFDMIGGIDSWDHSVMTNEDHLKKQGIRLKALNDMLNAQFAILGKAPKGSEERKNAAARIEALNQEIRNTDFLISGFRQREQAEKDAAKTAKDTATTEQQAIIQKISNGKALTEIEKKQVEEMKKNAELKTKIARAEADWQARKFNNEKANRAEIQRFSKEQIEMDKEILKLQLDSASKRAEVEANASKVRFDLLQAQKAAEIETLDAIAADEQKNHEVRMQAAYDASQKRLELIQIQKDAAIQANHDELVSASTKYGAIRVTAQQKLEELDKIYEAHNGKVSKGNQAEYDEKKTNLEKITSETDKTLENVYDSYVITSDKITKEFGTKVEKETVALFKLKYQLEEGTFEKLIQNVKQNFDKWQADIEAGSTSAWQGVVSDSGEAIKAIGGLFGKLPSDLAPVVDSLVNVISSALSGNPIQTATAVIGMIGKAIFGAGEKSEKAADQEKIAADQALNAARAFLKSQGKLDLSLMSASEISEAMTDTATEFTDLMKGLGKTLPKGITSQQALQFAALTPKAAGIGASRGYFTPADYASLEEMFKTQYTYTAEAQIRSKFGDFVADQYKKSWQNITAGYTTKETELPKAIKDITDTFTSIQQLALSPELAGVITTFKRQTGAYAAVVSTAGGGAAGTPTTWMGKKSQIEAKISRGELTPEEGAIALETALNETNPYTGKPYWYEVTPQEYNTIKTDAAIAKASPEAAVSKASAGGFTAAGYATVSPITLAGKPVEASRGVDAAELYLDNWAADTTAKYAAGQITAAEFRSTVMTLAKAYAELSNRPSLAAARIVELRKKATDLVGASAHVWQDVYGAAHYAPATVGGVSITPTAAIGGEMDAVSNKEASLDDQVKELNLKWSLGKITSKELTPQVINLAKQYRELAKTQGISSMKSLVLEKKAADLMGSYANVWQEEYGKKYYGGEVGGAEITGGIEIPSPLGKQLGVHILPGMAIGAGDTGQQFINAIEQLTNDIAGGIPQLLPDSMDIRVTVAAEGAITDGQAQIISISLGEAIGNSMTAQGETP